MQIVGGLGIPHTPHFPNMVASGAPLAPELERLYGTLRTRLTEMRADVAVFFSVDHYNLFFVDSLPVFSVGVADRATGPSDYDQPQVEIELDAGLGRALQAALLAADFDAGKSQEFALDHPFTIPLTFVNPALDLPVVPVWIGAFDRPIPSAARCFALGRAIRGALEALPDDRRVVAMASGSFSLDIGGPRMSETSHTGVPAPEWLDRVMELLRAGDVDALVAEATDEQLWQAGSAGGELLLWIAMLGMLDPAPPAFLEAQREWGHAYGAWVTR